MVQTSVLDYLSLPKRFLDLGILPYMKRLTALPEEKLLSLFGWMVAINPLGQVREKEKEPCISY